MKVAIISVRFMVVGFSVSLPGLFICVRPKNRKNYGSKNSIVQTNETSDQANQNRLQLTNYISQMFDAISDKDL